jgi:hypothetical protein
MRLTKLGPTLCLALISTLSAAQVKLEKIGAFTDASAPAAVRDALEATGYRIASADGSSLCDIWLRKAVAAAKAPAAPGLIYPDIQPSAVVGVAVFPKSTKDFRNQAIKPGMYTLRYELIPEDGNHLGVSANRDFLLAVPAASDPDPNAMFEFQQVVNMSKPAIGGNHPSPWSLVPADKGDVPRTYQNADGFDVLVANVTTSAGKIFPLALVVKGQAQQ